MQPLLIASDIDGVGSHWDKRFDHYLDQDAAAINIPRHGKRSFTFHRELQDEERKLAMAILERPGFYAELEEMEGWRAALEKMEKDGHDVILVTSAWESNPTGYQDKADWIARVLGPRWRNRLFIGPDKTIIDADVLIDDKPNMKGRRMRDGHTPPWTRVVYDQPYNQEEPGLRIFNWIDGTWEDVIYGIPSNRPR